MFENETPTNPSGRPPASSSPCVLIEQERQRRKASDAELNKTTIRTGEQVAQIETRVVKIERNSRLILGCVGGMVLAAALEYAGLIGKNIDHTVWSHAILDGVKIALSKQAAP